ncbi:RNA polymerase sigma factor SigX [Bacillus sp. THAF10]|uniref:RNA polymerase sigma factor n=1 Tax=Bacillus sp. THAF10 TaxID=2587848 RepID=UPI0012684330|nr:RNA polymerase sigma factor [Bacillus sp. THAF10]QFT87401.1 RNA polymerase sigma factor SigX [Bacillus sp. THAF10]
MSKENEIDHWFVQYHQTIYKYIFLMVKDAQEAEDLTQDTFVRAYQYYSSFKRDSSPKTWLFKIAHNTTIDYLRKRKPLRIFANVFLNKEQAASTEDILLLKENSRELLLALNKLKDTYKQVIILRKIKGFSVLETAHILGWSESKVKSTLMRAIQALSKEWMDEEENKGEKRAKQ